MIGVFGLLLFLRISHSLGDSKTDLEKVSRKLPAVNYVIDVKLSVANPDCYGSYVLFTANGTWPGPLINVTKGQLLNITVRNEMFQENAGIHWHGIKQRDTPYFDGVPGVSQCAIPPGGSMTYEIDTNYSAGTYWYHSHYSLQNVAALYGPLIINPPYDDRVFLGYDEELTPLMLGDWYHTTLNNQSYMLNHRPSSWVGDPHSLLINGKGIYDCYPNSTVTCTNTSSECGFTVIKVTYGKTYRLRIINAAAQPFFNFAIEGHNLTVVETEGNYVTPVTVATLDINAGQTYSVLLKANKAAGTYWINTKPQYLKSTLAIRGAAILQYSTVSATAPKRPFVTTHPAWNDTAASLAFENSLTELSTTIHRSPLGSHRNITILLTETMVDTDIQRESVNNRSFEVPFTPLYLQSMYGLLNNTIDYKYDNPPKTWNYSQSPSSQNISSVSERGTIIYTIKHLQFIQVVIQNTINNRLASSVHPFHLHGHDFWVLGHGIGTYNATTSPKTFNTKNPVFRNTATVFPGGWVAIKFFANNPGIWLYHCHNSYHFDMGMGVVFNEAPERHPLIPADFPICGDITTSMIRKRRVGDMKKKADKARIRGEADVGQDLLL